MPNVSYQEVLERNQHMKREMPSRITYALHDISPECGENGCLVSISDMDLIDHDTERLSEIITLLNDEIESMTRAYNNLVDAYIHLEFAYEKCQESNQLLEKNETRNEIISGAKQVVLAGMCGLLLSQ